MPPPIWTRHYRGYHLVQWFEGGPIDICFNEKFVSIEHTDRAGASAVIDEWLDAP